MALDIITETYNVDKNSIGTNSPAGSTIWKDIWNNTTEMQSFDIRTTFTSGEKIIYLDTRTENGVTDDYSVEWLRADGSLFKKLVSFSEFDSEGVKTSQTKVDAKYTSDGSIEFVKEYVLVRETTDLGSVKFNHTGNIYKDAQGNITAQTTITKKAGKDYENFDVTIYTETNNATGEIHTTQSSVNLFGDTLPAHLNKWFDFGTAKSYWNYEGDEVYITESTTTDKTVTTYLNTYGYVVVDELAGTANTPPEAVGPIPDIEHIVGSSFNIDHIASYFKDADNDVLDYGIQHTGDGGITWFGITGPGSWYTFEQFNDGSIIHDIGTHTLKIIAYDPDKEEAEQIFKFNVVEEKVEDNNPTTGAVTITGIAKEGEELTASNNLEDLDGMGAVTYTWLADGVAIAGASSSTYTLTSGEVGKSISVKASYTDDGNTPESKSSAATVKVEAGTLIAKNDADRTDEDVSLDSISVLTNDIVSKDQDITIKSVSSNDGKVTINPDMTTLKFVPNDNFNGDAIIKYIATDGKLDSNEATVTVTVNPVNDAPTGSVTITGLVHLNAEFAAINNITDVDGMGNINYVWSNSQGDLLGSGTYYHSRGVDFNDQITVTASYTDDDGTDEVFSNSVKTTSSTDYYSESPVNTSTNHAQTDSSVATLKNGCFVITWVSPSSSGIDQIGGVFAQMYNSDGTILGNEFHVKSVMTTGVGGDGIYDPQVISLSNGGFTVSWLTSSEGVSSISGQIFNNTGTKVGGEFTINNKVSHSISPLEDGGFVIASEIHGSGISIQKYDSIGTINTQEIDVGAAVANYPSANPYISSLKDGGFVVSWSDKGYLDFNIYNANGTIRQDGITYTKFYFSGESAITSLADGGFLITWDDRKAGDQFNDIYAQRFDLNGISQGDAFRVNTDRMYNKSDPEATTLSNGDFVITWASTQKILGSSSDSGQDGSYESIHAQIYKANGDKQGGEILVNTTTGGNQENPNISALDNGEFIITWEGVGFGDIHGVFAQKFDGSGNKIEIISQGDAVHVAMDDAITINNDTSLDNIDVLSNDTYTYVANHAITNDTYIKSAHANNGTVVINNNNTLKFIPKEDFNGDAIIKYIATDGSHDSNQATLTITTNHPTTGAVTITGIAKEGEELTASNNLEDLDGMGAVTYTWLADGVAIAGASSSTYTLTSGEVGKSISVKASYTDDGNTPESKSSAATVNVEAKPQENNPVTGEVTITGIAKEGEELGASNNLEDLDGMGAVTYTWLADGVVIAGASSSTYTLTSEEVGKSISVKASYTDDGNTPESKSSAATVKVESGTNPGTGTATGTVSFNYDTGVISLLDGNGSIVEQAHHSSAYKQGSDTNIVWFSSGNTGSAPNYLYTRIITNDSNNHVRNEKDFVDGEVLGRHITSSTGENYSEYGDGRVVGDIQFNNTIYNISLSLETNIGTWALTDKYVAPIINGDDSPIGDINGTDVADTLSSDTEANLIQLKDGDDTATLVADGVWTSGYAAKNMDTSQTINLNGKNKFADVTDGGLGSDTLNLTATNDAFFLDDVYSQMHANVVKANTNQNIESAQRVSNIETINTGAGDDIIDLTSINYQFTNNSNGLTVFAEAGNDVIWGSSHNDWLYAGEGNDIIYGGAGSDTMIGMDGNDTFQFSSKSGTDTIGDFSMTDDKIEIFYQSGENNTSDSLSLGANGVLTWSVTADSSVVINLSGETIPTTIDQLDALITFIEI